MAATKKSQAAARAKIKKASLAAIEPTEKYVTKQYFEEFASSLMDRLEALAKPAPAAATVAAPAAASKIETPVERDVRKAGPTEIPMNPEWEDLARDIIGEAVDHCEIQYLKKGGMIFTVVIKNDFSNAGVDYLERMHSDRRSKEVGAEGIEGVEAWCRLVKSNLARPR